MFLTLFSNTFASQTRVKWGILGYYNDTALSRGHPPSNSNSIVSLTLQNTLTKMSVQHFPIVYEAVTNTFMLDTNHWHTRPPFSRSYTSINLRYTTICKFQDSVIIRVTGLMCFNDNVCDGHNNLTYSYDKTMHNKVVRSLFEVQ